ncbi:MAG: hypothetical protein R6V39_04205 [Desulfovibrionales bacterium]
MGQADPELTAASKLVLMRALRENAAIINKISDRHYFWLTDGN